MARRNLICGPPWRRPVYAKIALLALAALAAFLGAAVVGVPSSPERRIGMFIVLPWVNAR